MTWDTDWSTGVSETISEIQSLSSSINALATGDATGVTLPSSPSVNGKFFRLVGYIAHSTQENITLSMGGNTVLSFSNANSPVLFDVLCYWDGSNLVVGGAAFAHGQSIQTIAGSFSVSSQTSISFSVTAGNSDITASSLILKFA